MSPISPITSLEEEEKLATIPGELPSKPKSKQYQNISSEAQGIIDGINEQLKPRTQPVTEPTTPTLEQPPTLPVTQQYPNISSEAHKIINDARGQPQPITPALEPPPLPSEATKGYNTELGESLKILEDQQTGDNFVERMSTSYFSTALINAPSAGYSYYAKKLYNEAVANADTMTPDERRESIDNIVSTYAMALALEPQKAQSVSDHIASGIGTIAGFVFPTPAALLTKVGVKLATRLLPKVAAKTFGKKLLFAGAKSLGAGTLYGAAELPTVSPTQTAGEIAKQKGVQFLATEASFVAFGTAMAGAANVLPKAFFKQYNWTPSRFKKEFPDMVRRVASNNATDAEVRLVQDVNAHLGQAASKAQYAKGKAGLDVEIAEPKGWLDYIPALRDMLGRTSKITGEPVKVPVVKQPVGEPPGKAPPVVAGEAIPAKAIPKEGVKPVEAEKVVKPAVTQAYDQFSKEYRSAFKSMMKYSPNEVGSQVFADKMAKMSEEHPDWVERIEAEEEAAETKPAKPPLPPPTPTTPEEIGRKPITTTEAGAGALLPTIETFHARFDALKKTGLAENQIRGYLETDPRTGNKAHWNKMTDAEKAGAIDVLTEKIPASLGAAAVDRLGLITKTFVEPGPTRLKKLLVSLKKSKIVSPKTKTLLEETEPEYELQRTKQISDNVLKWFEAEKITTKERESRVAEAEANVRDPAEDIDTKGAVEIALMKYYRNTGNNVAQAELAELMIPQSQGAGRQIQAMSMLNELTGKNWVNEIDALLKKSGVELPKDVRAEIEADLLAAANLKDGTARNKAVHAVLSRVGFLIPFKAGSWLDAYRFSNMLSNPQSSERNTYYNLVQAYITRPLTLIVDGDFKGTRTYLANALRDVMSGNSLRTGLRAYRSGDYSKWMESYEKADVYASASAKLIDAIRMEQGPKGKWPSIAWKSLTFIPKNLTAQDKFAGSMLEAGEIARLLEKGVSPEIAQKFARRLSDEMLARKQLGTTDPTSSTFVQALDRAAALIDKGRTSKSPLVAWPIKLTAPFLRVGIRLAQFSIESSPLGWLGIKLNNESFAQARHGKSFEKLSETEKLFVTEDVKFRRGLASIGSVVLLTGVGAALTGNTTWLAPQDAEARKRFYASGRRPCSFRIPGTNKWAPMMYLGPWFMAFAIPAAARDAFADNPDMVSKSTIEKLFYTALGIPRIILEQTSLFGMGDLLETLQGRNEKTTARFLGNIGSQFVPLAGTLAWINKMVDPVYRKPVTIAETIRSRIPGLSDDIKAYRDVTGIDAQRPWTDVYMPYTVGEKNTEEERGFQVRMEYLRFAGEINEQSTDFNDRGSELNQDYASFITRKQIPPQSTVRPRALFNAVAKRISNEKKQALRIIQDPAIPDDQKTVELQRIKDKAIRMAKNALERMATENK